MKRAAALGLIALLSGAPGLAATIKGHPFVDNETAALFGQRALDRGYVHHEEQRCGFDVVKFQIEVVLPFPKPPADRTFAVTGPDCAPERKAIIQKELARLSVSAFKKVRRRTVFTFNLMAKPESE